jgi:hypothetical protein
MIKYKEFTETIIDSLNDDLNSSSPNQEIYKGFFLYEKKKNYNI